MKKTIEVVAAIIENSDREILCAKRSSKMSLPNLWEFPGGKVESDESYEVALKRELLEELEITGSIDHEIFSDSLYEYEKIFVRLICLKVRDIVGVPILKEHSEIIWLPKNRLKELEWAPADISAIEKLLNG